MLEESAASVAHFSWLMAYAVTSLLAIAPISNQAFLGTTLSSTLVYIWSRRNPDVRLSFLGLLTFKAPWLPWVLIAFNVVLHGHWPKDELCGIAVGHVWYFFNDIYPSTHGGHRPMDPPQWWIRLFERGALAVPAPDSGIHAAALNRDVAAPVVPDSSPERPHRLDVASALGHVLGHEEDSEQQNLAEEQMHTPWHAERGRFPAYGLPPICHSQLDLTHYDQ
ncbi:hypothetical protein LTS00_002750 [Friedmanniomyces endolithicus]|uniref:Derlin n=1 Tax=Friedmanniomyces endolithicus TaxID=329885 RepID=A0AAN6G5G6_9PEZI|nr:hypothetical protein LTS00_002750 [Friedmanniomyces endolithicus]KAK0328979.1 hypothetical protein LTR82_000913 [Friedmanniomyces endolithicus]